LSHNFSVSRPSVTEKKEQLWRGWWDLCQVYCW